MIEAVTPGSVDWIAAAKGVGWILGPGAVGAWVLAWIGRRGAKAEHERAAVPIQVESPWLIQNLIEMKLKVEANAAAIPVLTNKIDAVLKIVRRISERQARDLKNRKSEP